MRPFLLGCGLGTLCAATLPLSVCLVLIFLGGAAFAAAMEGR